MTAAARRALDLALGFALPLGAALATLRFLIPSRLEGGVGGLRGWLARAGDDHPLWLGLALFVAFAAVGRYWLRRVEDDRRASAAPAGSRGSSFRFGALLVALVVVVLVGRASFVGIHRVTGASMAPTLSEGDRLLVNRAAYGLRVPFTGRALGARLPRRGDVVVFPNHGRVAGEAAPASLVKRVLGLPGDVVGYRDGTPSVNGRPLPACDAGPYLVVADGAIARGRLAVEWLAERAYLTLRAAVDETAPVDFTVPPGELFVVGDDRLSSSDSRTWTARGVRASELEGRVSRLAVGRLRDGRLDLAHPLAALGLSIRDARVDVRRIEARIAACLARAPR